MFRLALSLWRNEFWVACCGRGHQITAKRNVRAFTVDQRGFAISAGLRSRPTINPDAKAKVYNRHCVMAYFAVNWRLSFDGISMLFPVCELQRVNMFASGTWCLPVRFNGITSQKTMIIRQLENFPYALPLLKKFKPGIRWFFLVR